MINLLWLAGIAGVWYLLGTKQRRERRALESRPYFAARPLHHDASWVVAFLIVLMIILAFHH